MKGVILKVSAPILRVASFQVYASYLSCWAVLCVCVFCVFVWIHSTITIFTLIEGGRPPETQVRNMAVTICYSAYNFSIEENQGTTSSGFSLPICQMGTRSVLPVPGGFVNIKFHDAYERALKMARQYLKVKYNYEYILIPFKIST